MTTQPTRRKIEPGIYERVGADGARLGGLRSRSRTRAARPAAVPSTATCRTRATSCAPTGVGDGQRGAVLALDHGRPMVGLGSADDLQSGGRQVSALAERAGGVAPAVSTTAVLAVAHARVNRAACGLPGGSRRITKALVAPRGMVCAPRVGSTPQQQSDERLGRNPYSATPRSPCGSRGTPPLASRTRG